MFVVYWTAFGEDFYDCKPMSQPFPANDMIGALQFMEVLRKSPDNRFICMASENADSVGKQGVAAAGADYNWTKRRPNERTPGQQITRRSYNANDEVEVPLDEE